jgi:hypothetical protein
VNMSIQSGASGSIVSNLDRTGCSDPRCRAIRHQQILFYYDQLEVIERVALRRPDHTANAIVVIIAGNAGIDLDNELAALRQRFPNAFNSVKIVGGVDETGHIIKEFNHLTDNSSNLMAYARGKNVQAGTEMCGGTSFAGPEVARVLDYISSHAPGRTVAQVLSAFDQALREFSAQNILPQDANGFTTQAFLDRAVALATTTSPWDGTWVGTVTGTFSGGGCSYNGVSGLSFTFTVSDNVLTGTGSESGLPCFNLSNCSIYDFPNTTGTVSGSVLNASISLTYMGTAIGGVCDGQSVGLSFNGTRNGITITGTTPTGNSVALTKQ